MTPIVVPEPADWEGFRHAARALIAQRVVPHRVIWSESHSGQGSLLVGAHAATDGPALRLPRSFHEAGEQATLHRSHERWALLYRIIYRIINENKALLEIAGDEDVARLHTLTKAVKRDMHKMTAFVRFRSVPSPDGELYAAFYRPDHFIVKATSPFFARRFPSMRWSILTPDLCVHHNDGSLTYTDGVLHDPLPANDAQQQLWETYYANTFNPARLRTKAMRAEMPTRFWPLMPETKQLPQMMRDAPARMQAMIENGAAPRVEVPSPREPKGIAPAPQPLGEPPRLRIGVAGWDYPDWSDIVYSSRTGTDRLRAVAKRFDTIEVNSTFYRPVSEKAAAEWVNRIAHLPHFRFTAKLWRRFTHDSTTISQHDVATVRKGFQILLDTHRLVTVVAQFPWSFKRTKSSQQNLVRLLNAFSFLPLHVEFRHDSWLSKEVLGILADHNAGFVNIDQPELPHCIRATSYVTNRIAYIRLHGRNAENWFREDATRDERFDYLYTDTELMPWRRRVDKLAQRHDVDGVHVVFNNHYRAQAVKNAVAFARLVRG